MTPTSGRATQGQQGQGRKGQGRALGQARHQLPQGVYHPRAAPIDEQQQTARTLFVNRTGKPLSNQVIEIMVRAYTKQAGITKKVTPHVFRHSFATALVRNGADITAVRRCSATHGRRPPKSIPG